ncbi:MAG: SLBB domain-containing protein [Ignavibacteriaceae bacterium]|nr:SLBB domain-containing protein [Ignavibacteriaceae bacterium]
MKIKFLFILLIIPAIDCYSQSLPNYHERSFLKADSLSLFELKNSIVASEGVIDPSEYIIGPGDAFFLSISGVEEVVLNPVVNLEGFLYIPKIGVIKVDGETLAKTKAKVIDAINRYYKDVDVVVTLSNFKLIKVSLLGDVVKSNRYIISAGYRLVDLLVNSHGLNPSANYRNIRIKSLDGTERNFDLLTFLRTGNKKYNPLLKEGDIVIVDKADKIVTISGLVKYPAIYEYVEGETVIGLIDLAGGFLSKSKTDTIEIISFDAEGKNQLSKYYTLSDLKENNIKLRNQDYVVVREKPEFFDDKLVEIKGYVNYPGYYKIVDKKTTLSQIINEAGGFRENASLIEASLTRTVGSEIYDPEFERLKLIPRADMTDDEYDYLKAKSRQRKGKVIINFEDLFINKNKEEDIILQRGDVIVIPEKKNYVTLLGQVLNPGDIEFKPGLKVEDYIRLAGGFGWRALDDEVRVIKARSGEWVYADEVEELSPGDIIWIPEDPPGPKFWDVFTTSLQIAGQVASIIAATVAIIVASRN